MNTTRKTTLALVISQSLILSAVGTASLSFSTLASASGDHSSGYKEEHDGHNHEKEMGHTLIQSSEDEHDNKDKNHDHGAERPVKETDDHRDHDHEKEMGHALEEHDEHDEEDKDHDHSAVGTTGEAAEDHGEGGVTLSRQQMKLAGIKSTPIQPRKIEFSRYAPAEAKANGYTSYLATPRVDSIVVKRHANLGDHVIKGQPLVTLFSETVADAQAQYLSANAEWKRVTQLGRKAVGDKRYISAKAEYQAATSRLLAFGLDKQSIRALTKNQGSNSSSVLGEYTLTAQINGAVLSDAFHQGQRVNAGSELMDLANESEVWVEARLPANQSLLLPAGTEAIVKVADESFVGTVTQEAHTIDERTRTRVVRLSVNNIGHRLHPGMFADVYFQFKSDQPVMAVNEGAILRGADGDWTVYVEDHPGEFLPVEVEIGQTLGELREIKGVAAGSKVVTSGAFFVASQIAKGGFDPHNH
ncbi:efflux RND transporter periplasmic adaptor subunit [Bacterioplanoides pacificum]|uniref:Efflux RND transporter periplasmic adaptor subunit n=1 Tax=Bacterioplanoides pacificum TaxID=1171596 RepID=A0ABV7VV49_9GAMM